MKYCLLDYLAEIANVHYISELKNKKIAKCCAEYLQEVQEDKFTLDDWKDTCEYMVKDVEDITSIADAKKRILQWLQS